MARGDITTQVADSFERIFIRMEKLWTHYDQDPAPSSEERLTMMLNATSLAVECVKFDHEIERETKKKRKKDEAKIEQVPSERLDDA